MELSIIELLASVNGNGGLAEKVILFLIAFFMVKKEMAKQFDGLKESIKDVGNKLANMEHAHSARLLTLETEVKEIRSHIKGE
jgi:hypothetical protein